MSVAHRLRTVAADRLSVVLPYTAYDVDEAEYLGSYDGTVDETVTMLREHGYHYQLFAAEKRRGEDGSTDKHAERGSATSPSSRATDDGSYARIPESHPSEAADTALEDIPAGECQFHVHLFERPDSAAGHAVTDLYGHYEIHPYPHIPTWDLTRPYPRHYRPTWDDPDTPRSEWTYLRGVRDPRLDSILRIA